MSTRSCAARLNFRYALAIFFGGVGYLELVVALIRRPRPLGRRSGPGRRISRRTRRPTDTNHNFGKPQHKKNNRKKKHEHTGQKARGPCPARLIPYAQRDEGHNDSGGDDDAPDAREAEALGPS